MHFHLMMQLEINGVSGFEMEFTVEVNWASNRLHVPSSANWRISIPKTFLRVSGGHVCMRKPRREIKNKRSHLETLLMLMVGGPYQRRRARMDHQQPKQVFEVSNHSRATSTQSCQDHPLPELKHGNPQPLRTGSGTSNHSYETARSTPSQRHGGSPDSDRP